MKVIVDHQTCEGHGLCTYQAPDVFELDDDGELIHHLQGADIPADQVDEVSSAVTACPVAALRLQP